MSVGYGLIQSALVSASFTFRGETAHAGVAPWKGRDALDGVVRQPSAFSLDRQLIDNRPPFCGLGHDQRTQRLSGLSVRSRLVVTEMPLNHREEIHH